MNYSKIKIDDSFSSNENSNISRIRCEDPEELERLRIIENDPTTAEYIEDLQTTDEGLIAFAKGSELKLCIGVVGKTGMVDDEEVGKLQGWLSFYPDDKERVARLEERKMLGNLLDNCKVVEISYAKFPGARSKQMSGGLRQMIKILKRESKDLGEHIILTAYTVAKNVNSIRLLQAVGFQKAGEIEYHPGAVTMDEVWVLGLN